MKKLISTIMYSNKAAKINEYEKFVKWSKTKNMMGNRKKRTQQKSRIPKGYTLTLNKK